MGGQVTIYALLDEQAAVRYIGKTGGGLEIRLREHIDRCGWETSRKAQWIRAMRSAGHKPRIVALEATDAEHAAAAEDRQILEHLARGCDLMNGRRAIRVAEGAGPRLAHSRAATSDSKDGEVWLVVRIPTDMKQRLEAWAARTDMSMSRIVRRIIMEAHDKSKREQKDREW